MRKLFLILIALALSPSLLGQSSSGPFIINSSTSPCATINTKRQQTVGIDVEGTFSMTLQPEVSIQGRPPQNIQVTPSTSSTAQSTITSAGYYAGAVASYDTFLLCVSSYSSGTATIYLNTVDQLNASLLGGGGGGGGSQNPTIASITEANAPLENILLNPLSGNFEVGFSTAAGNAIRINDAQTNADEILFGPYQGTTPTAGTGYAVNDTGSITTNTSGQGGTGGTYTVTSVGAGGAVTGVSIGSGGTGYAVGAIYSTSVTTGAGDGTLALNVGSVNGSGTITGLSVAVEGGIDLTGVNGSFIDLDGSESAFAGITISNNGNGGSIEIASFPQNSRQLPDGWYSSGTMSSDHHSLTSICQANGTAANPSVVSCGSFSGGAFSCATAASTHTCVIDSSVICNGTGVQCISGLTTTSVIFVEQVADEGSALGVTCNTNAVTYMITARAAGSFTLTLGTFSTNPVCFNFQVS